METEPKTLRLEWPGGAKMTLQWGDTGVLHLAAQATPAWGTALTIPPEDVAKLIAFLGVGSTERDALAAENARLREALTPSAETKAAYIGEFGFFLEERDERGREHARRVTIPWTTIKEIMAAIRARALVESPR